jgi:endonuclease YncB( thermonuclease family)
MPAAQAANTVASIYDGDTLTLNNGAKVRLLQIDTPELIKIRASEIFGLNF